MAYELHIQRLRRDSVTGKTPIPLEEWRAAVEATEGVRLYTLDAHTITNPTTGEVIEIGAREGDAEVYLPDGKEWCALIRWFQGAASFNARYEPGHPVWTAAAALASHLGAVIRGDEGEIYDLRTGKVIK